MTARPIGTASFPPVYEAAQDYDDTFHVTLIAGGATVAVCPTWEDAVRVSVALNTAASAPSADDRLGDTDLCLREVEVTTGTYSGEARFLSDRAPDTPFLCLRPKPCDNPNHKPERTATSG